MNLKQTKPDYCYQPILKAPLKDAPNPRTSTQSTKTNEDYFPMFKRPSEDCVKSVAATQLMIKPSEDQDSSKFTPTKDASSPETSTEILENNDCYIPMPSI